MVNCQNRGFAGLEGVGNQSIFAWVFPQFPPSSRCTISWTKIYTKQVLHEFEVQPDAFCLNTADENNVSMRDLDRALSRYSYAHGKSGHPPDLECNENRHLKY